MYLEREVVVRLVAMEDKVPMTMPFEKWRLSRQVGRPGSYIDKVDKTAEREAIDMRLSSLSNECISRAIMGSSSVRSF